MVEKITIEVTDLHQDNDIINQLFLKEWRGKLLENNFIKSSDEELTVSEENIKDIVAQLDQAPQIDIEKAVSDFKTHSPEGKINFNSYFIHLVE